MPEARFNKRGLTRTRRADDGNLLTLCNIELIYCKGKAIARVMKFKRLDVDHKIFQSRIVMRHDESGFELHQDAAGADCCPGCVPGSIRFS